MGLPILELTGVPTDYCLCTHHRMGGDVPLFPPLSAVGCPQPGRPHHPPPASRYRHRPPDPRSGFRVPGSDGEGGGAPPYGLGVELENNLKRVLDEGEGAGDVPSRREGPEGSGGIRTPLN